MLKLQIERREFEPGFPDWQPSVLPDWTTIAFYLDLHRGCRGLKGRRWRPFLRLRSHFIFVHLLCDIFDIIVTRTIKTVATNAKIAGVSS